MNELLCITIDITIFIIFLIEKYFITIKFFICRKLFSPS